MCQKAAIEQIGKDVKQFKLSAFDYSKHFFNSLQDLLYSQFERSRTAFNDNQNSMIGASKKIPYYTIFDAGVRENFAGNLTNFINTCTNPTVQYFQENTVFPLFDYEKGSLSPLGAAVRPITDALDKILNEASQATNETCLVNQLVNMANFQAKFNPTLVKIKDCVTSTTAVISTQVNQLDGALNSAMISMNDLFLQIQACYSPINTRSYAEVCAIKLTPLLCADTTSSECSACQLV